MENSSIVNFNKKSNNSQVVLRLLVCYAQFPLVLILLSVKLKEIFPVDTILFTGLIYFFIILAVSFVLMMFGVLIVLHLSSINFEVTKNFKVINILLLLITSVFGLIASFSFHLGNNNVVFIYYPIAVGVIYLSDIAFFLIKVWKSDKVIALSEGSELTANVYIKPKERIALEDGEYTKCSNIVILSIAVSLVLTFIISQLDESPLLVTLVSWVFGILILLYQLSIYKIRYGDEYKKHLLITGIAYFLINLYVTLVLANVIPFIIDSPKDSPWILFLAILFTTIPFMKLSRKERQELN